MNPLLLLLLVLLGPSLAAHAQRAALVTGTVTDARTGAAVPYASVGVPRTSVGSVANAEGRFQLALPATGDPADSVVVQALGYVPLRLRLQSEALSAPQVLRLTPQAYQLQSVTVTGYTPESLLKKAIRTTARLMLTPTALQGYYREFSQTNGQYTKFADAQVDYYIKANPRKPGKPDQVQVRVRQSRVGEVPLTAEQAKEALAIPPPISLERIGNYYDVTERNDFLDSTSFKFYKYTVQETPGADYYLIRFTPTTRDSDHLLQGSVRVNRENFAIESITSEQPADLQQYGKEANLLVIKAKLVAVSKQQEYRAINGRYYPSFLRFTAGMTIASKRGSYRLDFTNLLLVTGVAPAPVPIPKNEQYDGLLYKKGTRYETPYWQQTSVVPATREEEAAIAKLATPLK